MPPELPYKNPPMREPLPRLSLAGLPTPLVKLTRASEVLGIELWCKRDDLTGHLLSGNKVRKLEFVLAEARQAGADTLITCGHFQSNHCRATAAAAARLGLACHLILRGLPKEMDGNLFLDQLLGAEITLVTDAEYAGLAALFQKKEAQLQAEGRKTFSIPTGASSVTGLWGYAAAWQELQQDFQAAGFLPDLLITATGSGGTLAGLAAGQKLYGGALPLAGISVALDSGEMTEVCEDLLQRFKTRFALSWPLPELQIDDRFIGPGYARAEQPVFDLIRWLAGLEGLILDPVYTGKAFFGLTRWIQEGRIAAGSRVLFLHTGGLFGTFAERQRLMPKAGAVLQ